MKTLQERLEKKKNEIGLVGIRLNFSRPREGKGISEHITNSCDEIVVQIRRDLDLAPDEQTKEYVRKREIKDPVETVATDLLYHGCGHRELPTETGLGCPYTVENHDRILSGVARALKEVKKEGLESYMANAFEDVLDNTNAKQHTAHAGQILFWNNEGLENNNRYTDFYEAFVKVNLSLMGEAKDATLLRRFYKNNEKTQKAVKEFTNYLKQKLQAQFLVRTDKKPAQFKKLFDKTQWEEYAYMFTKALAPLMDEQPKMRMCFGENPGEPTPFDKQIQLPEVQEKLAEGRYKAGLQPSEHTNPVVQLDALYRKISRAIPVKTTEYTQATGFPLVRYGRRTPAEEESVKVSRVRGIGFNDQGDLSVRVARHVIQHPAEYKHMPRNFPKLKIAIVDTSSSMADSPKEDNNVGNKSFIPWGDNSKYHYALKGLYGINNFLEKQGVAPYVQFEAIVFSGSTRTSGKRKFRSEEERKLLLRMPSGGTSLDTKLLQTSTTERCFLISVSDRDIANWDSVKEEYKKVVEGTDYCHIHIGSKNQFTKDLEKWGVTVKYVKGDEDLSRLMIDAASKYYREVKAQ